MKRISRIMKTIEISMMIGTMMMKSIVRRLISAADLKSFLTIITLFKNLT